MVLASLAVWSGHFEGAFQDNDFPVIVNNRAIDDPGNIPHFFTTPLLYAHQPELAEYRPLALLSFALDAALAKPVSAAVFQADSFVWFLAGALFFGLTCLFLPGSDRRLALLATALFAVHPLVGEALNYPSRRGDLIGAAGVVGGLFLWIVWPRYLPAVLLTWDRNRIPRTDWQEILRKWAPRINARYRAFVEAPLGFYLIPVVLGMLADPAAAVFPLLLLSWILLFDRSDKNPPWRRVLPSAIVCGLFWIGQLVFTWKYAVGYRLPAVPYWITQPWVVLIYLWDFAAPVRLTPESGLQVFPHLWSPLALAGIAGLAGLVVVVVRLGRSDSWRTTAFGLWWFLIALLPTILVPRRNAEADYRLYLPLMGLAIATAATGLHVYQMALADRRALAGSRRSAAIRAAGIAAAALILGVCCWLTFERNQVWQSQNSFWEDSIRKAPQNGRAFIYLGKALIDEGQYDRAYTYLQQAASLISGDAPDEVDLAQAFDRMNRDGEAHDHFQRALKDDPNYASAWSAWSRWLIARQRFAEALQAASRAVKLSPWNVEAKHTFLDYFSADSNWPELQKEAENVLAEDPTDIDARRSLEVAQAGFAALKNAEAKAKSEPTVDDFLALSVEYFKARRYQDVIRACREALKLRPDLAEAYHNMAAAYHALGKDDDAIQALREAVRIRPDLTVAKSNLEFLLLQQQNQKKPAAVSRP